MMKILFIQNIAYRFNSFAYSSALAAHNLNIEFHIASAWTGYDDSTILSADEEKYGVRIIKIDFIRNPYDIRNVRAYRQVVNLIKTEKYDAIHCNTPIGGVIGRLAGKKCGINSIIYEAHGFHFYHGAPKLNWLLYYPIEKTLAHLTDALITINKEDYRLAQRFNLRNKGNVFYVPGVGIDITDYAVNRVIKSKKREEIGIPEDSVLLISVGDLNRNKNNSVIIKAIKEIKNIHYIICGEGPLREELEKEAKEISDRVHFMGYRTDIKDLLSISDIYVMPSLREGLSRSLMEAMAIGLPCLVSSIRGNEDLIPENQVNTLINPKNVETWTSAIGTMAKDNERRILYGEMNKERVKLFSLPIVVKNIENIYRKVIVKENCHNRSEE